MILLAFRHGLRASELCSLRWEQVDLVHARLHVYRAKNGIPSVHPLTGTECAPCAAFSANKSPAGTYSLEEFQAAHACNFKGMDADKDGRLTMEEMQGFMQGSRRSVTMEEMQGFMQGSRRSVPRQ